MTEAEWLISHDVGLMLKYLRDGKRVSDRKQRLISVACCRHVWHLLHDERSRKAVEVAERYAEGKASDDELATAHQEAHGACHARLTLTNKWDDLAMAAGAVADASYSGAAYAASVAYRSGTLGDIGSERDQFSRPRLAYLALLARDVLGNPFRPVAFDPAWRTSTAIAIARGMYESRDFSPMPILADALQEVGCDSDDVLDHCRDPKQVHVRGCWVVDMVLGKE